MYRIDSMYEAMIEGLLEARAEGKANRWMATVAWWLARQQIHGATDYWRLLAARLTNELPPAEFDQLVAQLNKQEDDLLATVGDDWPAVPEGLTDLMASWQPAPPDLEACKADAIARIDASAEHYRLRYLTAGSGQALAYSQKLDEARAYVADPAIDQAAVPHIYAEAAATGMTPADKAAEIIATFEGWQQVSAVIEGKRAAAKLAVQAAETPEAVKAAANVEWEGV